MVNGCLKHYKIKLLRNKFSVYLNFAEKVIKLLMNTRYRYMTSKDIFLLLNMVLINIILQNNKNVIVQYVNKQTRYWWRKCSIFLADSTREQQNFVSLSLNWFIFIGISSTLKIYYFQFFILYNTSLPICVFEVSRGMRYSS